MDKCKLFIFGKKYSIVTFENYKNAGEQSGFEIECDLSPIDAAKECDAILFSGGSDLNPKLYGEENEKIAPRNRQIPPLSVYFTWIQRNCIVMPGSDNKVLHFHFSYLLSKTFYVEAFQGFVNIFGFSAVGKEREIMYVMHEKAVF